MIASELVWGRQGETIGIARMQEAVRLAMAEVVHVDVTVNDNTETTEGSTPTAE